MISGPIWIVLSGQARAILWGRNHGYSVTENIRSHSYVQNIFSSMTVTSHQHWNTGEFETLSSGVHEFSSTFQLPASIPSSHDDLHGYIRYTLTAVPAKKFDITRQKSRILVNELVRIDTPMLVNPRSLSNEKTIGCLCCITRLIVLLASDCWLH